MPVLPTTAYSQAEDALTLARALVNDTSGAVFTDTLLMPPAALRVPGITAGASGKWRKRANGVAGHRAGPGRDDQRDEHRDQRRLHSPQLPTDGLMPHVLWERATANTCDVFVPI